MIEPGVLYVVQEDLRHEELFASTSSAQWAIPPFLMTNHFAVLVRLQKQPSPFPMMQLAALTWSSGLHRQSGRQMKKRQVMLLNSKYEQCQWSVLLVFYVLLKYPVHNCIRHILLSFKFRNSGTARRCQRRHFQQRVPLTSTKKEKGISARQPQMVQGGCTVQRLENGNTGSWAGAIRAKVYFFGGSSEDIVSIISDEKILLHIVRKSHTYAK